MLAERALAGMIEERHLKKIIIAVCVFILLIPIGFIIFINIVFYSGSSHDTIKTVLGDRFKVEYDYHKCESTVTCKDSDLYWHYGGSISEDDFIPLEHTDSLTVYELKSSFIFCAHFCAFFFLSSFFYSCYNTWVSYNEGDFYA